MVGPHNGMLCRKLSDRREADVGRTNGFGSGVTRQAVPRHHPLCGVRRHASPLRPTEEGQVGAELISLKPS